MKSILSGARLARTLVALLIAVVPTMARAAEPALDTGDTAWLITATALVLFMTLPGLALFYGGLVRVKNVLSVLMHCFAIAALVSILWLVAAYSIAFGEGNAVWGGLDLAFLAGVGVDQVAAGTGIPETVFFMFQMTFAIITPALIVGAFVERIRFSAILLFTALWVLIVYAPLTHWIWGGGWLYSLGVLDFAGGLVVHASCGITALIMAVMLGRRAGFPGDLEPPHNPGMTMMGAAMLWVGWFGFNAGSALAADGYAGMAMVVTHISAATAAFVWMLIEWVKFGKPSLVGIVTGTIAGLATITPGSGYVGPGGALVFGVLAAILCYWFVTLIKFRFGVDDSLDVFAVHGVGGMLGIALTGIFASERFGGLGLPEGMTIGSQVGAQLLGIVATLLWAGIVSVILLLIIRAVVGLRVSPEEEVEGLDITTHGERAFTP